MEFSTEELTQRRRRIQTGLTERGWGCAVLTAQQNFVYVTDLRFDALWSSASRSFVCVLPADGPLHLLLPNFLVPEASEAHPDAVIVGYDPPRHRIDESLIRMLTAMPPGPIGWEAGSESRLGLALETIDTIRRATRDKGEADVSDLLWHARMRKSPAEIAALSKAARAGSSAFEVVFGAGVAGRTESEIARALAQHAIAGGASTAEWVVCTSGSDSYHRFVSAPRERTVGRGDLFWADIGLTSCGYWTDFCRAAVAGSVSSQRSKLQAGVVEATTAGIGRCRPGVPVAEVAATIRERASELGLDLLGYGRLGHGIGLSSTEPPSIAEWDRSILEAGMVVTIEPALSHSSGLYCAEQVVVVTDTEPEVLTTASCELTEA